MDKFCNDCDKPATREWDTGEVHARMIGVRFLPMCDDCWRERDNAEPQQADGYLDRSAELRDEMELARGLKR